MIVLNQTNQATPIPLPGQGTPSVVISFITGDGANAPCTAGRRVLGPFLGGGATVLEASRLGADVHGVDVEPVAAAIAAFQGRLGSLPSLESALDRLRETVGAELARYYRARDEGGRKDTMLHALLGSGRPVLALPP